MDISDIVTNAVKDAEEGVEPESSDTGDAESSSSDSGDSGTSGGTGTESDGGAGATAVSLSSGTAGKTLGETVAKTPKPEDDELVKEMAKFGITPPVPGKREGLFRWAKVQKVVENARIKTAAKFEKDLKDREDKLRQATERLAHGDAADHLIASDPEKYLRMLAAMHPAYQRFLGGVENGRKAEPATKPVVAGPPPPDAEFPDGSKGYSPEGLERLMQYHRDQAKSEAVQAVKDEYEKRFGPIEQDWKQSRVNQAVAERQAKAIGSVRSQIETSKKTWGAMFQSTNMGDKEDDPEIVQALADHPDWSFEACVNHVLVPRMQANRDTMRKDILAELDKAPAAASRSVATSAGGSGGTGKARSIEDIVREATSTLR